MQKNPFAASNEPKTREEWQQASDTASILLLIEHGWRWGMWDGKGRINIERCKAILKRGRELTIEPRAQR